MLEKNITLHTYIHFDWGNQAHFVVKHENNGLGDNLQWYEISGMALQVDNFCEPATKSTLAGFP